MFKKKLSVSIYNTVVLLYVVDSMDDMQVYLDKKVNGLIDVSDSDGCVFDMNGLKGIEYYIVFVKDKLSHNLIAHETFHLGVKITSDINIKDEESIAWLVGHLTEKIYKILRQKKFNIEE